MDWMYKGPAALVDREEYLLGRTVDKSLKYLDEAEKGNQDFSYANEVEKDLTPLSIFAQSSAPVGPIDVIRKIKEDPLYQIQKKEEESLKQLLKNPVKMKQLSQLVEERTKTKSNKRKKSKSKHKKKSRDSSSDSSSDSDKDKKVEDRFLKYKKQIGISEESDKRRHHSHRKERSRSRNRERNNSSHNRYKRDDYNSGDRKQECDRKGRETKTNDPTSSSSSASSFKRPTYDKQKRATIDEAEKERRRREMMDNAKWRDEQRIKSVTKYREETKLDEEKSLADAKHEPDFIRQQLNLAAASGSVEKRIKSNSYNIQKSKSSMSQNFARR